MKKLITIAISLLITITSTDSALADDYWIKVEATTTGQYTVNATIQTNIPGPVVLAANLALQDQKPQDIFIGTSFIRVPVSNGKASITIDGSKRTSPYKSKLPTGEYDVEVSFHPLWPDNKAVASANKIDTSITGQAPIHLTASETSSSSAKTAAEGRLWVMENVYMHYPWDPKFWQDKFGEIQEVDYQAGNPDIIKMYYVKSINMTLMVNVLKGDIVTWRSGLAHK